MNARTLIILAVAAVLLAALAIVAQNRSPTASIAGAAAGSPLFPALEGEAGSIDEVSIDGAGEARLVTLERAGDAWTVAEQDDYAADFDQIRSLVVALAEASVVEEKTANPDFYGRLGVEDVSADDAAGVVVTLRARGGDSFAVVLGNSDGTNQRYARRAGEPQSFLIDRNPDIARDPSDWVVADLVDIETPRVQRVEITHSDGERLVIRKATRDETNFAVDDVPEGRELQYESVANVTANVIRDLRLEAVRRAEETPAAPAVVVEYWTFDGLVLTVAAAPVDDAGAPWLTFSARYEPMQATAFAAAGADEPDAAEPVDTANDASQSESRADDVGDPDAGAPGAAADDGEVAGNVAVMAEVRSINERVEGWRYRIASYQYDQMTRRLEDLLREPAAAD